MKKNRVAVLPINLETAVTGQIIIDATRVVAKNFEQAQEAGNFFAIGQSSSYPYEDLAVINGEPTDGNIHISPSATYSKLLVVDWEWPGAKYCIGYGDQSVINAATSFSGRLQTQIYIELSSSRGTSSSIDLLGHYIGHFLLVSRIDNSFNLTELDKCRRAAVKLYERLSEDKIDHLEVLLQKLNSIDDKTVFSPELLDSIQENYGRLR